jgi:hypothetical protein
MIGHGGGIVMVDDGNYQFHLESSHSKPIEAVALTSVPWSRRARGAPEIAKPFVRYIIITYSHLRSEMFFILFIPFSME